MELEKKQILTDLIKKAYGSLENPNYRVINKAMSDRPYDSLIEELNDIFVLNEITDTNDDVCFYYTLESSESGNGWDLQLSLVGRYAVIIGQSDAGRIEVVTPDTSIQEEKFICSLLMKHKIEILRQDELEWPISLKLFNTDPENVCIYQALFSDLDILPWKSTS